MGQLTPPSPSSSFHTADILISGTAAAPWNNASKGSHCVLRWWQGWKTTVHETQWEGIREGREEFCIYSYGYLFSVPFLLLLSLPLPSPSKGGLLGHRQLETLTHTGQQITLSGLHHNALLFPSCPLSEHYI